jgi:hypothetical protein
MSKLEKLIEQQKEIQIQIDQEKQLVEGKQAEKSSENENRFLIMGFWEFAIISTLMTVFFPWSLLYCVVVYGLQDTKFLIIALFHDVLKTVLAVLSIVVPIVGVILYFVIAKNT